MRTATKLTEAEWFESQKRFRRFVERHRGTPDYEPQAELLARKHELECRIYGEIQEIAEMVVEPELYETAYIAIGKHFLSEGPRNPFPLPVPEREYKMWGVRIVKAE